MLESIIRELAGRMGLKLSVISFADDRILGGGDAYILDLESGGAKSCVLVYQSEMGALQRGSVPEQFSGRIRGTLLRLQYLQEHAGCGF